MSTETLLQQILAANKQQGYPNIDRSTTAMRERQRYQQQIQRKNSIEGLNNPTPESLEGRLIAHFIVGNISASQMVTILRHSIG